MSIRILGISGSPRKAACESALAYALQSVAGQQDVQTEQVDLAGKTLNSCLHCNACLSREDMRCVIYDDDINPIYPKLLEADIIVCATPVYHMGVAPLLSILMSRTKPLSKQLRQGAFGLKVGVAIAVGGRRNGGQELAINTINNTFLSMGMVISGSGVFGYHGVPLWSNDDKKDGIMKDLSGLARLSRVSQRALAVARVLKAGTQATGTSGTLEAFGFSGEDEWSHAMEDFYK